MKKIFPIIAFVLLFLVSSCQTRVVDHQKPMQKNSIELYEKYTITTNEPKIVKIQVLKQDDQKIYGKTKTGEEVVVNKSDVVKVKKIDWLSTVFIGAAAVAAVIFVPI